MKDFETYGEVLKQQNRHKIKKSQHIIKQEVYQNFCGFTEYEMWGNFADFDYEKWLKEQ